MLGLGKEVLSKIQNLLVQIDKKKTKIKQDSPNKNQKKKQKSTNKNQNHLKQQKTNKLKPQQKQKPSPKPKNQHKISEHEEENQNLCSSRIQHLYLNHFIRQKKLMDRNVQHLEDEMRKMKTFKVQNKTSQFLNQKKSLKPIYERTEEILQKREKSIEKIKKSMPKTQRQIEQEQLQKIQQYKRNKYPKLSKYQFERKMEEIQRRNLQRMQQIQRQKLMNFEERSMLFLEKPKPHPANQQWWEKKKLKKNLSSNILERFSQYDMEKKQKWQRYLQKRRLQETPFTPRISQITRQIARKSLSRKSLLQDLNRSHSCRALSKREDSFMERRDEVSMQRSISKNLLHGKSATTTHSSRHALIQRRMI